MQATIFENKYKKMKYEQNFEAHNTIFSRKRGDRKPNIVQEFSF